MWKLFKKNVVFLQTIKERTIFIYYYFKKLIVNVFN